ncbi:MAG: MFS transporter [Armatimonadota bacterium]
MISGDRGDSLQAITPVHRLIVAAFVMDMGVAMVGMAVQFMGNALEAAPTILGLLGTASPAAYTLGCLVTGRLSDRFGRRLLNSAACLVCAAAWLAMTQAETALQLLAIIPVSGAAISMFWPPLQAWLSEVTVGGRRHLVRNIGGFNISWTIGLMLGPPAAGLAWDLGHAAPFIIAAAAVIGVLMLLQTIPAQVEGGGEADPQDEADAPDGEIARRFLYLAWIANFASWFGRGMNIVVFPKLGTEAGLRPRIIGTTIAIFLAGQLLMFLYLRTRSGWQYRLWPLLAALGAGSAGWLIAYSASSPLLYAVAFAIAGMGAGVTYVSSLYYSLQGHAVARGARTGIHEAVLGSGIFLGPLFGGLVADHVGLNAPYLATAALFALFGAIVYATWRRMRINARRRAEQAEVLGE